MLKIAALFHDIGRTYKNIADYNKNHAELSAEIAAEFLRRNDFKLSQEDFDNIIHCIRTHSFSNNVVPQTLEATILSDADKLDALGAIGLYRTIGFTIKNQGGVEQVIGHLENKILDLLVFLDMIISILFEFSVSQPNVSTDISYKYQTGTGAFLMLGWTILLIWADRSPIERKNVLLLTAIPVVVGIMVINILYTDFWFLSVITLIMFIIAYFLARSIDFT
ncbi:MAG: hypothetical protein CEE43_03355 [Promethearchaeota archaeon Loki_b32]|nr:MAG: hypothetical protein CEE43_03355 [Candidatus Lokiarchaeota archaeon Loki_b32]